MQQALLVRLRPSGPWRYGPSDGALDRVDTLYRSDRLFSAITIAMRQLGTLDSWLDATARSEKPAVAFTSLFPFQGDILYVTPPANLWPPPSSLVNSPSPVFLTKVRWRAAHFVPLSLVDALMTGQPVLADQWIPDPESGCLLRRDRPSSSPFRNVSRAFSPVDRLSLTSTSAEPHTCVEFEQGAGLWTVARFIEDAARDAWHEPLRAAFRLLSDSGFGGGRSKGWGQVQSTEFETGNWPALILPKVARSAANAGAEEPASRSYWLMSLYSPSPEDKVNWSAGQYELTVRNGRVDGSSGVLKKSVRMVVEGCVLDADAEPIGVAIDVAPEGFAHPVYRSGIALALLIPPPKPVTDDRKAVELIVPPELAATPFPMPEKQPEVVPPEITPEKTPEPQPETTPDHKPEVEPAEQPEQKPELAPEPSPETAPQHEPEVKPEHTPEVTPLEHPETVPEPKPQTNPEPHPEITPQHEPEVTPEHEPEVQPQHHPEHTPEVEPFEHPEAVPEHKPEVIPEPHPAITPQHEPLVNPEHHPESTPEHTPEVEPFEHPVAVPEHKPEMTPEHRPEVQPQHHPEHTPEHRPEVAPHEHPETVPEHKPEVIPEPHPAITPQHEPVVNPEHEPVVEPQYHPEPTPGHKPEVAPEPHPETAPGHSPEVAPPHHPEMPQFSIPEPAPTPPEAIVEVVPEDTTTAAPAKSHEDTGFEI